MYAPAGLKRIVCKDSETRQTLTYVRMLTYAPAGLKRIVCKDSETRQLCKSHIRAGSVLRTLLRQYLYFCTSKASKLSTWAGARHGTHPSAHAPPSSHFLLLIRQHTSAYVSIRQHTSAYVSIRQHTSVYVSIRPHTSAYVSIRQHTSAYVSSCWSSLMRQIALSGGIHRMLTYALVSAYAYVSIRQHTSAYVSSCWSSDEGDCSFWPTPRHW
jgi:hypothetical protein